LRFEIELQQCGFNFKFQIQISNFAPMDWTQIIGLAAGVCTATSLLPQVVKTFKEKKAEDVSLGMLFVLMAGIILWIVYGFKKNDLPIIATNFFSLAVNITMTALRIKYHR
jgi:MtN3 and saliva related transmembrane protein